MPELMQRRKQTWAKSWSKLIAAAFAGALAVHFVGEAFKQLEKRNLLPPGPPKVEIDSTRPLKPPWGR